MSGGLKTLRKIQWVPEVTPGTPVTTATLLWRGGGTLEDLTNVVYQDEEIGYISGVDRAFIPSVGGRIALNPVACNIFQLPYLLEMGIKSVQTGAADGSGTDKIYAYPFPTTSKNTVKSYTIQAGDDVDVEQLPYGFCEDITLSGQGNGAVMMGGTLAGQIVTDLGASYTPSSLALQTALDDLMFNKGKIYLDAVGGTIGTTQIVNSLHSFTLKIKTGWLTRASADGNLKFSYIYNPKPTVELDLIFVHDSTAVSRKTDWRALTARQLRLQFPGAALSTPGTTYSTNALRIDLAGKGLKVQKLGEDKGEDVLNVTYRAGYNTTAALFASITCALDGISALP